MKKIFIFIALIIGLFALSACGVPSRDIAITDALSQDSYSYYVYFSKDDCPACTAIKSDINTYAKFTQKNTDARPIFEVNLSKDENKFAFNYPDIPNPQDNWKIHLLSINEASEIRIASTPSLVLVREGKIIRVVSGSNDVLNDLNNQMDK